MFCFLFFYCITFILQNNPLYWFKPLSARTRALSEESVELLNDIFDQMLPFPYLSDSCHVFLSSEIVLEFLISQIVMHVRNDWMDKYIDKKRTNSLDHLQQAGHELMSLVWNKLTKMLFNKPSHFFIRLEGKYKNVSNSYKTPLPLVS